MVSARSVPWLLPALAAVLLFLPVLGAGFVHDDVVLLRDNPNIQSWDGVATGFARPFWEIAEDPRTHVGGFYRPLGVSLFVLLHQLGGGSPLPYHLASLLLHAAAAALVALLALRLGWKPLAAGLAGMLFAVHGMHVEAVAWASSLTYLLASCCALGGLLALLGGRWLLAGLALAAAMLSQEAAIGVWLLAVGWQLFRGDLESRPRWPGLAALAGAGLGVWLLRVQVFDDLRAGFFGRPITELSLPPAELWAISFSVHLQELRYLVWPWPHAPFRPLPSPESLTLGDFGRWGPALGGLLVLATAALWWLRGALRWRGGGQAAALLLPVGLLFAGMLPLLSTSNLGQFPFEERFLYLPSAGFALVAGYLLQRARAAGLAAAAGLVLLHAWSALAATGHWSDKESFTTWGMEASPHAMLPFNEFGWIRLEQASALPKLDPERQRLAAEAEEAFATGLAISPADWVVTSVDRQQGNLGLATALFYQGSVGMAEQAYGQILERWPSSFQARHGLGTCLAERGLTELEAGNEELGQLLLERALAEQIGALEAAPDWTAAIHAKGLVLARLGRAEEALPLLERAVEKEPANRGYLLGLAQVHWESGRADRFEELLQRILDQEPEPQQRAEVLFQAGALQLARAVELLLGGLLDPNGAPAPPSPEQLTEGRSAAQTAARFFRQAFSLDAQRFDALQGVASGFELMGRPQEGLAPAKQAFAGRPWDFPIMQTLFRIQVALGQQDEARQTLEVWLRAAPEEDPARPLVVQDLREWQ